MTEDKTIQEKPIRKESTQPLGKCTLSSTPEHVRLEDPDEPCDDGREG